MEDILGLLALALYFAIKALNLVLKVVFFPFTISSMISDAKTKRN